MFSTTKEIKPKHSILIDGEKYSYQELMKILNPEIDLGGPEPRKIKRQFAFKCGGKRFYTCLAEELPAKRYKEHLVTHEEMRMGIKYDTLKAIQDQKKAIIKKGRDSINFTELLKLDFELDFRLENAPFEDHIWDMCAVMYFELDEDLTTYNIVKNKAKIAFWKEHDEPADFFLRKPVKELIGLKELSREDLKDFLKNGKIKLALFREYTKRPKTG